MKLLESWKKAAIEAARPAQENLTTVLELDDLSSTR